MGKKTTKTSETKAENVKTTPDVPAWIQQPQMDLTRRVSDLISPERMEQFRPAAASPLQQQAFASQLGGGTQYLQDAAGLTQNLIGRGANTAGVTLASLAPQGPVQGYDAPRLGQAGQAAAPVLAGLERVSMPTLAGLERASAGPLAALERVSAPELAGLERVQAQSYLDGGIDRHLNPYLSGVVDTTAADLDVDAGRTRARQSAQAALNGAFGGSRFGLREAETEGELSRARGSVLGGLRFGAYDRATGLAGEDANRRQGAASENARAANARAEYEAGLQFQAATGNAERGARRGEFEGGLAAELSRFNADAGNRRGEFEGGLAAQIGTTNAEFGNRRGEFEGGMLADLSRFNVGEGNRRVEAQGGFDADAGRFRAGAENDRSGLAFTEGNRMGLANAEFATAGARFNAGQADAALERDFRGAGMLADLGRGISAEQRADTGMLAQLGQTQYDQQLAQQQHEMAMLRWAQGLGPDTRAYSGQTVVGNTTATGKTSLSDPWGTIGTLANAAGTAWASDARLKRDIRVVARHPRGFNWVSWTWNALGYALGLTAPERQFGVLAQEVREVIPEAVIEGPGGVLLVNYGALA